mmetsp:Transcript_10934/g.16395  ORF Transcript_10934/g.16395 Transcript_10934/m.16395 type:complete len:116 (+) Transcript_10934:2-349(+)
MQQAMQHLQTQASHQPLPFQHYQQYPPYQHQQQEWFPRGCGGFAGRGRYGDSGRNGGGGPPGPPRPCIQNSSTYCWTHGGCGHPGVECFNKVRGYKVAGTFQNKMGGSTLNCLST